MAANLDGAGFGEDHKLFRNETGFSYDADFYSILNISHDATLKDIKRSYKSLSLTFHPDKLGQLRMSSNLPTI